MHLFFLELKKKCISGQNIMSSSPLSSSNLQTDTEKQRKRDNSRYFLSIRTLGNKTPFPTFTSHFTLHTSHFALHNTKSSNDINNSLTSLSLFLTPMATRFTLIFAASLFLLLLGSYLPSLRPFFSYSASHNVGASIFYFSFFTHVYKKNN